MSLEELGKLKLSKNDCVVGGVCGGLGKYTSLAPWMWRAIFIASALYLGIGLIPYAILYIVLDEED